MKKGFTLIEITVVVSIIVLLGTIFIINYRGGEKQFALQRSAHKLSQSLRGAQEMAMSAQIFEGSFPAGGYGISLQKDNEFYILFADLDGDGIYDDFPNPEKIEEISLENGIYISQLLPSSDNSLAITFFPPAPEIKINNNPN